MKTALTPWHDAGWDSTRPLRIALIAPPWSPVPPPGDGGIEAVLAHLAGGLVRRQHDVTLLSAPGSRSAARVLSLLEDAHPNDVGETLFEVDHVARAMEVIAFAADEGEPFDVVHDHSGYMLFAVADHLPSPVLHTLHAPFTPANFAFYRRHADKAWVSGLSRSQLRHGPANLRCVGPIPNPLDLCAWPFEPRKRDYLLWMGPMSPDNGAHRAIAAARAAGRPLVLAGPIQPGQRSYFEAKVAQHIDGVDVRYVQVGAERKPRLLAEAAALLMPIRGAEPFGTVMIEAMACGTPVLAFPDAAAPEVVVDGESGFLVDDEDQMAAAIGNLHEIDPARCRRCVAARYDIDVVAGAYEAAYRHVIASHPAVMPFDNGWGSPSKTLHNGDHGTVTRTGPPSPASRTAS
jgi:glycosyltransferase involved in cell wall biosynthesis